MKHNKNYSAPFIIWFNERSGSTHLVSLLNSHSKIACFHEIFYAGEGSAKSDVFQKSTASKVDNFLDDFFSYQWGVSQLNIVKHIEEGKHNEDKNPKAVGFKLKYNQVKKYPQILDCLFRKKNRIKVIHLVRKNLLSTLVSSAMIPKLFPLLGRANLRKNLSIDEVARSVTLNPNTLLKDLQELEIKIIENRKIFADLDTIEINYESLVNFEIDTCSRVLKFLGVNENEILISEFQKIMPLKFEDSISNFQEIKKIITGSKYSTLLDNK